MLKTWSVSTRRLQIIAIGMVVAAAIFIIQGSWGLLQSREVEDFRAVIELMSSSTRLVIGLMTVAFALGVMGIRSVIARSESLFDWLGRWQTMMVRVGYPLDEKALCPLGQLFAEACPAPEGWLLLLQAPGVLFPGEMQRSKYFILSAEGMSATDQRHIKLILSSHLENPETDQVGIVIDEWDGGESKRRLLCWIRKEQNNDIGFAIGVPIGVRRVNDMRLRRRVYDIALDLVVKRLGTLLIELVETRERTDATGYPLVVRQIAHEVNGEMQGLYNTLDELSVALADNGGRGQRHVKQLNARLRRAVHYMDMMRDAPFFADRWIPVDPNPISLNAVLADVVEITRAAWPDIVFSTTVSSGDCQVMADVHLASVLRNILFNAASFSPEDGEVAVSVSSDERFARIYVEDEGPGVPEDLAEAIFDPLRPSGERPTPGKKGMGVGLAIARIIARAYGGDIRCLPNPDKGGLFEIAIPLAQAVTNA